MPRIPEKSATMVCENLLSAAEDEFNRPVRR
jgi:hypothetical protein